ncbi:MAG: NADPH-dependent FMN reductase [Alphaproteobacteria bacterium]
MSDTSVPGAASRSGPLHVLAFAGSLRRASYNRGLLQAAAEEAPAGLIVTLYDLTALPMYNYDLEAGGFAAPVHALREAVRAADAVLIASPENNGFMSAVAKNAVDWLSRPPEPPVAAKPAAIMGATSGRGATARMQPRLREFLVSARFGRVMETPVLGVAGSADRFDDAGRLTDDATRTDVRAFMAAFEQWLRQPPAQEAAD